MELCTFRVAVLEISPHPSCRTNTAAYFMLRKTTNTHYLEQVSREGSQHVETSSIVTVVLIPSRMGKSIS